MANLRTWLEMAESETGETIEAMVVGQHDQDRYGKPFKEDENVILTREAGLAKVDLEYNNGYGGANCFPLWAWTKSFVYFVSEYDGATGLACVPRHPIAGKPAFSGNEG